MGTRSYFTRLVLLYCLACATLFMVACNQTAPLTATFLSKSKPTVSRDIHIIFEGPWAFAPDPQDANGVVAIAPKTARHRDLFVQSWEKVIGPGVYDLSLPVQSRMVDEAIHPKIDSTIFRAPIDRSTVQRVLDDVSQRYAIRLPKPDAYVPAMHYQSRVGSTYPPDASPERDYATSVSLRYTVTSMNGIMLAGTPDDGTMNPLLLRVDTPVINFVIGPAHSDLTDQCNLHSRGSFGDLTRFLDLTLFVDFPNDPGGCRAKDPQNVSASSSSTNTQTHWQSLDPQASDVSPAPLQAGLVDGELDALVSIIRTARSSRPTNALAAFLFGMQASDCHSPIIVGGTGP